MANIEALRTNGHFVTQGQTKHIFHPCHKGTYCSTSLIVSSEHAPILHRYVHALLRHSPRIRW